MNPDECQACEYAWRCYVHHEHGSWPWPDSAHRNFRWRTTMPPEPVDDRSAAVKDVDVLIASAKRSIHNEDLDTDRIRIRIADMQETLEAAESEVSRKRHHLQDLENMRNMAVQLDEQRNP